jgi:hypothetical protein
VIHADDPVLEFCQAEFQLKQAIEAKRAAEANRNAMRSRLIDHLNKTVDPSEKSVRINLATLSAEQLAAIGGPGYVDMIVKRKPSAPLQPNQLTAQELEIAVLEELANAHDPAPRATLDRWRSAFAFRHQQSMDASAPRIARLVTISRRFLPRLPPLPETAEVEAPETPPSKPAAKRRKPSPSREGGGEQEDMVCVNGIYVPRQVMNQMQPKFHATPSPVPSPLPSPSGSPSPLAFQEVGAAARTVLRRETRCAGSP